MYRSKYHRDNIDYRKRYLEGWTAWVDIRRVEYAIESTGQLLLQVNTFNFCIGPGLHVRWIVLKNVIYLLALAEWLLHEKDVSVDGRRNDHSHLERSRLLLHLHPHRTGAGVHRPHDRQVHPVLNLPVLRIDGPPASEEVPEDRGLEGSFLGLVTFIQVSYFKSWAISGLFI